MNEREKIEHRVFVKFMGGRVTLFYEFTILHGDALVLDAADVAAELVLALRVLYELRLHAEAPHLLEGRSLQLHLVQNLGAHFYHFVRMQLDKFN